MKKILIVEDNLEINNLIKESLINHNYKCTQAFSGSEALLNIEKSDYTLIILDLMLPGLSGEDFIEKFRKNNNAPILVVSAKDSIDSKINSLKLGADDYLVKPFNIKELHARVEALIRRSNHSFSNENLVYKGIKLENNLYDVSFQGSLLNLTLQEYKVMKILMEHPSKIFTKQELYELAWDDYYMGEDKTINVHISNIRKKIAIVTKDELIETVWGIGFKLKE